MKSVNIGTVNGNVNINANIVELDRSASVKQPIVSREVLDLRDLVIDKDSMQRPLSKSHLENIQEDFDPWLALNLSSRVVVVIGGVRYLIDGQHNTRALLNAGHTHAACFVVHGMTKDKAAECFLKLNGSKKVGNQDKYYVGLAAGHSTPTTINTIVTTLGFTVARYTRKGMRNNLRAIKILTEIYNNDGSGQHLARTLNIVKSAFAENGIVPEAALKDRFLLAISNFIKKNPHLSDFTIIKKMRKSGLDNIIAEATNHFYNRVSPGRSFHIDLEAVFNKIVK